ncbi:unnamed protein product [Closterium sp. Naga37s-1]|nr:unnamed protein product [Closterium sp. Naga37s-1]
MAAATASIKATTHAVEHASVEPDVSSRLASFSDCTTSDGKSGALPSSNTTTSSTTSYSSSDVSFNSTAFRSAREPIRSVAAWTSPGLPPNPLGITSARSAISHREYVRDGLKSCRCPCCCRDDDADDDLSSAPSSSPGDAHATDHATVSSGPIETGHHSSGISGRHGRGSRFNRSWSLFGAAASPSSGESGGRSASLEPPQVDAKNHQQQQQEQEQQLRAEAGFPLCQQQDSQSSVCRPIPHQPFFRPPTPIPSLEAPRSPAPSTRPAEAAAGSRALRADAGNAEGDAVDVYGVLGRCEAEERGSPAVRPQGACSEGDPEGSGASISAVRSALAEAVGGGETAAATGSCWEGLLPAVPAVASAEEDKERKSNRAEAQSAGEDVDERGDAGGAGGDADDASLLDGDLLVDILSPPDDGHGRIPAALHCTQHSSAKWFHPPLAFPVPPLSIPPPAVPLSPSPAGPAPLRSTLYASARPAAPSRVTPPVSPLASSASLRQFSPSLPALELSDPACTPSTPRPPFSLSRIPFSAPALSPAQASSPSSPSSSPSPSSSSPSSLSPVSPQTPSSPYPSTSAQSFPPGKTRWFSRAGSLLAPPPAPLGALFSALAKHLSLRVALWRRQRLLKAEAIGGAEGIGRGGSVRVDARTVRAIVRAQEELRAEVRAWCVAETSGGKAEGRGLGFGDESGRGCGIWGGGELQRGEEGAEREEEGEGEAVPGEGERDGGSRVWFEWNGWQYYLKPWQAIVGDADFPGQYARIVSCLERLSATISAPEAQRAELRAPQPQQPPQQPQREQQRELPQKARAEAEEREQIRKLGVRGRYLRQLREGRRGEPPLQWLDDAAAAYVLDGGEWQHVGSPRFCAWIAHVCRFPHWHMPCVARRATRSVPTCPSRLSTACSLSACSLPHSLLHPCPFSIPLPASPPPSLLRPYLPSSPAHPPGPPPSAYAPGISTPLLFPLLPVSTPPALRPPLTPSLPLFPASPLSPFLCPPNLEDYFRLYGADTAASLASALPPRHQYAGRSMAASSSRVDGRRGGLGAANQEGSGGRGGVEEWRQEFGDMRGFCEWLDAAKALDQLHPAAERILELERAVQGR